MSIETSSGSEVIIVNLPQAVQQPSISNSTSNYSKVDSVESVESEIPDTDAESDLPLTSKLPLRRSKRKTAGKHSNPFNLPRSALTNHIRTVQNIAFSDLSNAMSNLSLNLASVLERSWLTANKIN